MGYESIVLACRTEEKAAQARRQLVEDTGVDPFSTLAVDVASLGSSREAATELVSRGAGFDSVLLNAGMVPHDLPRASEAGV